MKKLINTKLLLLFWFIVFSRFFAIFLFPLTDTTEARYGHIALLMSKTNDWITPYFDYNIPFWGKPPLSFWAQALSYDIFGIHDFSARIPSLLITLATAWLIYEFLTYISDRRTALLGIIIYMSTGLVYVLSGAILTDSYLVFATTLSLISFLMVLEGNIKYWSYLFFIGIGFGLLAKGPLDLVIVGGIISIWVMFSPKTRTKNLSKLPWLKGTILMLIISLPWYILAEIKTPGFLHYFIIGEHIDRFLDPGWQGDLYGSAHKRPHGEIWLMWLFTSLPWGFIGLVLLLKNLFKKNNMYLFIQKLKDDKLFFYIIWMLFIMLFFTMSGNILGTYILPSLPPLAIILALYFRKKVFLSQNSKFFYINSLLSPFLGIMVTIYILYNPSTVKTEKFLIAKYKSISKGNEPVYFVRKKSFSSTYYMNKKIDLTTLKDFNKIEKSSKTRYFAVVNKNDLSQINKKFLSKIYASKKYILYMGK